MYLSSFRIGDHPEHLIALLGDARGPAAVIANSCDGYPTDRRDAGVDYEISSLAAIGIEARELDLREFFGQADQLKAELDALRLVWVRGGNTFVLRHAMAASGADALLVELLRQDALVYAGYSAGVCVLAPSMRGLEGVDEPELVRTTYRAEPIWEGLGLLDHLVLPHYDSPGHFETEAIGKIVEQFRAEGRPHETLRDGQAIVIDGARREVV